MSGEIERVRPIKDRFDSAVSFIKTLPKGGPLQPSNAVKLRFYALFKQSTQGPCTGAKPSFWDAVGRAKWEAWNVCGKMRAELAMQMYIEELQQFVGTIPPTPEVGEFLQSIGPHPQVQGEEPELQSHTHSSAGEGEEPELQSHTHSSTKEGEGPELQSHAHSSPGEEDGASEDIDTDGPLRNSNSETSRGHSEGVRAGNRSDSEGSEDFQESFMYFSRTPGVSPDDDDDDDDSAIDQYPREASVEQGASPLHPRQPLSGEVTRTQTRALNDEVQVQISRWRSRVHYRLVPFLLSWPFALQFIIRFLVRRYGSPSPSSSAFPWWVWSLVTFLHTTFAMSLLTIFTHPPSS